MKIKFITKMHLYGLWGFVLARGGCLGGWVSRRVGKFLKY